MPLSDKDRKEYNRQYYLKNKERHNELGRRWKKNNPEKRKEEYMKYRPTHIKKMKERYYRLKALGVTHTESQRFATYRISARKRNLLFDMTREQFAEFRKAPCHYCGSVGVNGVDRKDNALGYVNGNMLSACGTCNKMKLTHNYEFFISHCKKVASLH